MSTTFQHSIFPKLLNLQRRSVLSDYTVKFGYDELPCHFALLKSYCTKIRKEDLFVEITGESINLEVLSEVLTTFYARPLLVSVDKHASVFLIAHQLGFTELIKFCLANEHSDFQFSLSSKQLIQSLQSNGTFNHEIHYKGTSLKAHRFILAACFRYFEEKFTLNCPEQHDCESDFSNIFTLTTDVVQNYWLSLYDGFLDINSINLYPFYLLSYYLQFTELVSFVLSYMGTLKPSSRWVERCLVSANENHDLVFVQKLANHFNKYPKFVIGSKIILHEETFKCLTKHLTDKHL
ncbi:hypothetical protein RCL1_004322 [Eukaryota sp. TZLM3-RCL]